MAEHCSGCRFFNRTDDSIGLCRFDPPKVIPMPVSHPTKEDRLAKPFTTWPVVRPTDWCGQYEVNRP